MLAVHIIFVHFPAFNSKVASYGDSNDCGGALYFWASADIAETGAGKGERNFLNIILLYLPKSACPA